MERAGAVKRPASLPAIPWTSARRQAPCAGQPRAARTASSRLAQSFNPSADGQELHGEGGGYSLMERAEFT